MEEEEFSKKIEKSVIKSMIPKESTEDLINEVTKSSKISSYFRRLLDNENEMKLLFLHKKDLLGIEDEFKFPYVYLCNYNIENEDKNITKSLEYFINADSGPLVNSDSYFNDLFGLSEDEMKSFLDDGRDLLFYYGLNFIRNNPSLVRLIKGKNFSYSKMKTGLKDYKGLKFDIANYDSNKKVIDEPAIKTKIEKLGLVAITGMMRNLDSLMNNLGNIGPSYYQQFHLTSNIFIRNILKKSEITIEEYMSALDELYRYDMIMNRNTVLWCKDCSLEKPFIMQMSGSIAPSKIGKTLCPKCNSPQTYAALFEIDSLLEKCIMSQDGILSVFFGWILSKERISYDSNVYTSKFENDFLIKDDTIVEIKMFKSEKDKDAIRSELISSLSQIKKHIQQFEEEGMEIKNSYFLWNRYNYPSDLENKMRSKFSMLFTKYNLKIINPMQIQYVVESMK